jgi:hypothetical protein
LVLLPAEVQQLADEKFNLLRQDPRHPSLRLKKVGSFWSARIGLHYRALARDRAEGLVWFWISCSRAKAVLGGLARLSKHGGPVPRGRSG